MPHSFQHLISRTKAATPLTPHSPSLPLAPSVFMKKHNWTSQLDSFIPALSWREIKLAPFASLSFHSPTVINYSRPIVKQHIGFDYALFQPQQGADSEQEK